MVPCSSLTFDVMMASAMNALTDVDVVRGITSFVALKTVVLALIAIFPKPASLLMSLTKVAPAPLSVLTVINLGCCSEGGGYS